jgi:hypothetical protein
MPLENTFYCCLHLCPKKRPTEYGSSQSKLKFVKVLDSNFLSLEALPPYLSAPRYACGRARDYGESTVVFFFSNEIKWLLPGCSLCKALNTHTHTQTHTDRQTHTHSVYMYTCIHVCKASLCLQRRISAKSTDRQERMARARRQKTHV